MFVSSWKVPLARYKKFGGRSEDEAFVIDTIHHRLILIDCRMKRTDCTLDGKLRVCFH